MKRASFILAGLVVFLAAGWVEADHVIGVTGSDQNGGTPYTIYEVDTTTGVQTFIGSTDQGPSAGVNPNVLAWNRKNLYYFGNHAGTELYAFDTITNTTVLIADLLVIPGTGDFRRKNPCSHSYPHRGCCKYT